MMSLVRQLPPSRFKIDIVVLSDPETTPLPPVSVCPASINFHFLNCGDLTRPGWRSSVLAMRDLSQLFRKVQPELVHAWCGHSAWITLAADRIAGNRKTRRLFYTELWLQEKKRFLKQSLENSLGESFETIVVPHSMVEQDLRNKGFRSPITLINNREDETAAIDLGSMRAQLRKQLNLPSHARLAGTFAPLVPRSRIKDLIWATDLLVCIRNDFHLVVYGTGWQLKDLQRFARCTEAEHHIHFCGCPHDWDYWQAGLDVYWHSHLQEPCPYGMLNAMQHGVPVVSVFGPGTEDLIRHQETGLGTNFGARDEFARWTRYLLEQEKPAQQLALQGQQFVGKIHPGSLAEDYLTIYDGRR